MADYLEDSSSEEEVVVFTGWKKAKCEKTTEDKIDDGEVRVIATTAVVHEKEENMAGEERDNKDGREESDAKDAKERKDPLWSQCLAGVKKKTSSLSGVAVTVMDRSEAGGGGVDKGAESKAALSPIPEEPQCKPSPLSPGTVTQFRFEDKLVTDQKQVTPTEPKPRLFSEPPQFNYDRFERECIPSDKRFALVFPDDIEKRTKHKDLLMEHEVLGMWDDWFFDSFYDVSEEDRGMAYALWHEVGSDEQEVGQELQDLYATNTDDLAKWEFDHLDNDGETTRIEKELVKKDIFHDCEKARAKYGHLGPTNIERWERRHLRHHRALRSFMKQHDFDVSDVFADKNCGSVEVKKKYGYLAAPSLDQWESVYLDEGGGTAWVRLQLLRDENVFKGCEAAKERYGCLVTDFERWEAQNLEHGQGGKVLFKEKYAKHDHLFEICDEARSMFPEFASKYPHLLAQGLEAWELRYLDKFENDRAQVKTKYLANTSIFQCCDEARMKYPYLMAEALQCWERRYLVKDVTGRLKIKNKWRSKGQRIFKYCGEAGEMYAYLTSTRLEDFQARYLRPYSGEDDDGNGKVRPPRSGWFEYDVFRYSERARALYQNTVHPDYKTSIWFRDVNMSMLNEEGEETAVIIAYRQGGEPTAELLAPPKTAGEEGMESLNRTLANW